MASKFHRSGILTGYVESYCLVCESLLRSEDDIIAHIGKPIHTKNLDSTAYKYKDECVRKVKKGYFCEFCNLLLPTLAKVGLHIAEIFHIDNKGTQLLSRHGTSILAYNVVVINDKAWNSFIDNTCVFCDMEFNNEDIHKAEATHIVNMIQAKVKFDADNNIYRNIDESSFQCLTCNLVFAMNSFNSHFNETSHKALYAKCQLTKDHANSIRNETNKSYEKQNVTASVTVNAEVPVKSEPKTPTEKQIVQSNAVNQNARKTQANIKNVDFDKEICKALGAKDYIAQNENGRKWCILCDWTIDIQTIDSHVQGRHHLTLLKMHKNRLQNKLKAEEKANAKTESKEVKVKDSIINLDNRTKILRYMNEFKRNDVTFNVLCVEPTAYCSKCSKNIDFVFETIQNHIEEHNRSDKVTHIQQKEKTTPTKIQVVKSINEDKHNNIDINVLPGQDDCKKCPKTSDLVYETFQNHIESHEKELKIDNVEQNNKTKILNTVTEFQQNDILSETALRNNCSKTSDLVYETFQNSVESHKEKIEIDTEKQKNKTKILDAETEFQQNAINILSETALCNKFSKNVEFAFESIQSHVEEQKRKSNKNETVKKRKDSEASSVATHEMEEVKKFAKDNNLIYNLHSQSDYKVYCKLCDSGFLPLLKCLKEHVDGTLHKTKEQTPKEITVKIPQIEFIKSTALIESFFTKDVVINEKYCINILSFLTMTKHDSRLKCQVCDTYVIIDQLDMHLWTPEHERANDMLVLASLESEFVRELHTGLLHCGYCNLLEADGDLDAHLKCTSHRESKTAANWRLQQYVADVAMDRHHRQQTPLQIGQMMQMIKNQVL